MNYKIYVDLDGVMANFEKAIVETCVVHYWDRMGKKFWTVLEKDKDFFSSLELLPGSLSMFKQLVDLHGYEIVEVLTALPNPTGLLKTAGDDKRSWVRDMIDPNVTVNTIVGGKNKHKFLEENPKAVLIDDYDRNIKLWVEHGGCGILHVDPDSTIAKLKLLGLL